MMSITGGDLVSKIKYWICDICGNTLKTDIRFIGYVNGRRIWNKLFNSLGICNDCIDKIKWWSIDKKDEEKYVKEVFDQARNYDNPDMKYIYYESIEDTLNVLSQKRLVNVKIK